MRSFDNHIGSQSFGQLQEPRAWQLFPKGNCGAGTGLRGPCRISVSRLARVAGTKEVHLQFQNLEMKSARLFSSSRARYGRPAGSVVYVSISGTGTTARFATLSRIPYGKGRHSESQRRHRVAVRQDLRTGTGFQNFERPAQTHLPSHAPNLPKAPPKPGQQELI